MEVGFRCWLRVMSTAQTSWQCVHGNDRYACSLPCSRIHRLFHPQRGNREDDKGWTNFYSRPSSHTHAFFSRPMRVCKMLPRVRLIRLQCISSLNNGVLFSHERHSHGQALWMGVACQRHCCTETRARADSHLETEATGIDELHH